MNTTSNSEQKQDPFLPASEKKHYPKISIMGDNLSATTTAACLAHAGFQIMLDNLSDSKTEQKAEDATLNEMISLAQQNQTFTMTNNVKELVLNSDLTIICPQDAIINNDQLEISQLIEKLKLVAETIALKQHYHVIVLRTALPPGTTRSTIIPFLETQSGKQCGKDFGICIHPDFVEPGNAVASFHNPSSTIIGAYSLMSLRPLEEIFRHFALEIQHTTLEVAELIKYVDTTWQSLKQTFANEIGRYGQSIGMDSHELFELLSSREAEGRAALIPGPPICRSSNFNDIKALKSLTKVRNVKTPLINDLMTSNKVHIEHTISLIEESTPTNSVIGFLGITDDEEAQNLYENPFISIMSALYLKGYNIRYFDPVSHNKLIKGGEDQSENVALSYFLDSLEEFKCETANEVLDDADTLIVTKKTAIFRQIVRRRKSNQKVIDLVRLFSKSDTWPTLTRSGVDDFVPKPATKESLHQALEKWCSHTTSPYVLLAEDEATIATVTRLILEQLGCRVDLVENGLEAVNAAKAKEYDLILMDLSMPLKSGLEASEIIRRLPDSKARVPILSYSNYTAPEQSSTYAGVAW